MKVLFISQYFPPEIEIGGTKVFEIAHNLKAKSVEPIVLTGYPNFPRGRIFEGYENNRILKVRRMGLTVIRIPIYPNHSRSVIGRMVNQFSFLLSGLLAFNKIPPVDCVLATSPPLFVGLLGWSLAKVRNIPFIFEVRDLWPESALQIGVVKPSFFTGCFQSLQTFLYSQSVETIALTKGVKRGLARCKPSGPDITVIRNGVDTEVFRALPRRRDDASFRVGYVGTLSLIHGIDVIIETAKLLVGENIEFHITGEGIEKERMKETAGRVGLQNLIIHEAVPKSKVPTVMNQIDVGLVTVKDLDFCKGTVPAKMFEYWACEKPIILAVKGEAENIARKAGAAICVDPENEVQIRDAILEYKTSKSKAVTFGKNGRQFVIENASRKITAEKYWDIIFSISKG